MLNVKPIKVLLSAFIALIMSFSVFVTNPLNANAAIYSNFIYSVSGNTVSIDFYLGNEQNLTLPDMIGGFPVTNINTGAFLGKSQIKSVTLPASLKIVGSYAFFGCTNMTVVSIPEGVTNIGEGAFLGCVNLAEIKLPSTVFSIGPDAFSLCASVTSVSIPDIAWYVGGGAFSYCVNLKEIIVSEANKTFCSQDGVLFNKLKTHIMQYPSGKEGDYSIPATVTDIDESAFQGNFGISKVTLPDSIINIGFLAFADCPFLTGVNIPYKVTDIEHDAFMSCYNFLKFSFNDGPNGEKNQTYKEIGGVIFDITGESLLIFPSGWSGVYQVPNGTKIIEDDAFAYAKNLNRIVFPASLKVLHAGVFNNNKPFLEYVFLGNAPTYESDTFINNGTNIAYCLDGNNGFGRSIGNCTVRRIVAITTVTDKIKKITGNAYPLTKVNLTIGKYKFVVTSDSKGKWSKTLTKVQAIGTKISASTSFMGVKYSKAVFVRPEKPIVKPVTTKSKWINGTTYPKAKVYVTGAGNQKYVIANLKGAFAYKITTRLDQQIIISIKVEYKGKFSEDLSIGVG